MTLREEMGFEIREIEKGHIEATMPVDPRFYQDYGIQHGGATLAFLESMASVGTISYVNPEVEQPFGIEIQARHRKPARSGMLHGTAILNRREGNKLYWDVAAYDEEGDVISDGVFMTKIVSYERLREKERERELARAVKSDE